MNTIEVKKIKKRLYMLIVLVNLILIFVTYKLMPIIQNYPPNSESIAFQKSVEQFSHIEQYLMIFIIGTAIQIYTLNRSLRNIYKFLNKYYKKEKIPYEEIKQTRDDCITVPYKYYLFQIVIVLILGMTLTLAMISNGLTILKFFLMLLAITTLIEIIQFIFIQRELKSVIVKTYDANEKYEKNIGMRLNFSSNLILQIIPFLAVSIIIISLIGYAKATEEYGNTNATYYEAYLDNRQFNNITIEDLKNELNTIPLKNSEDYYFIISPNYAEEYTSKEGTEISDFFKKYLDFYFDGESGIVYEFYGTEQQAFTIKLYDDYNRAWYIGFEYSTTNHSLMTFYVSIILGVLAIYTVFIYILAKNISNNIVNVSNSLKEISEKGKTGNKGKIAIFSNDEIGDLSYYYNKIEELTEKHEKELRDNEYVMQRQAQFFILGEFAGGLAHDLNSPLSAVKLDISTLRKYMNSDKVSANDNVKSKIDEMLNNIDSSLNSMGNTIMGVRNQIRATGDSDKEYFLLKDVIDGINILYRSLLMKNNCLLQIDVPEQLTIYGERNKLDRVIGNIIKNSIDAYVSKGEKGTINITAKEDENNILIKISDRAGGIDENIKDKIFKEMKTTKAENGTGFGLYYSNTIIESSFKGKMYFETEKDIGTVFYIELPKIKEEV